MIAQDKIYHFAAGWMIADSLESHGPFIAFFWALLAGSGKELLDEYLKDRGKHPTGFDVYDLLVTITGAAARCVIMFTAA